jgi:hypothetical protein
VSAAPRLLGGGGGRRRFAAKAAPKIGAKQLLRPLARRARGQGRTRSSRLKARAGKTAGAATKQRRDSALGRARRADQKIRAGRTGEAAGGLPSGREVRRGEVRRLEGSVLPDVLVAAADTLTAGGVTLSPPYRSPNCAPAASTPSRTRTTTRWRAASSGLARSGGSASRRLAETRLADLVCLELEKAVTGLLKNIPATGGGKVGGAEKRSCLRGEATGENARTRASSKGEARQPLASCCAPLLRSSTSAKAEIDEAVAYFEESEEGPLRALSPTPRGGQAAAGCRQGHAGGDRGSGRGS